MFTNPHGSIFPVNIRNKNYFKIYIKISNTDYIKTDSFIWKISPIGFDLKLVEGSLTKESLSEISNVRIIFGPHKIESDVQFIGDSDEDSIYGFRFINGVRDKTNPKFQRKNKRWDIDPLSRPRGSFKSPGSPDDIYYYDIINLSKNGMTIITSMRNKFILRGMNIKSEISFPLSSSLPVNFDVINIDTRIIDNEEKLCIGCRFNNKSNKFKKIIGSFLFQFSVNNDLRKLSDEGITVENSRYGFTCSAAITEDDFIGVLKLRELAYGLHEKKTSTSYKLYSDKYDSHSRIIIAKYKGKIVGTCRLIFNNENDTPEHFQFIDKSVFPKKPSEFVELTRLCTHPDFRRGELLLCVLRAASQYIVESGRVYILSSCKDKLLNVYTKLGFEATSYKYQHKDLGDQEHRIIVGDSHKIATGRGVNIFIWNIVWKDVVDHLTKFGLLKLSLIDKLRISIFRLLSPLAIKLYSLKVSRKVK